jgi:hypothetical protein
MRDPRPGAISIATFRARGFTALPKQLAPELLDPVARAAQALAAKPPRQALLSGAHNPFGRAPRLLDAWRFLELCESAEILDAVEAVAGPDLVLWDSELYLDAGAWREARYVEGRYWPADPLEGVVADVAIAEGSVFIAAVERASAAPDPAPGAHYIVRYMPATSHYNRDPRFGPNRRLMEEQPLINYANRPIWLARGEDRARNDFAMGFAPIAPGWAAERPLGKAGV